MKIQLLVDNPKSWAVSYANALQHTLSAQHSCTLIHDPSEVTSGDILVLLSCEKLFKQYDKNRYNIVVHASDLPKGKGWSPLIWQILAGKNRIPITLFEATDAVDAGDYYLKDVIELDDNDLLHEAQHKMGLKINEMVERFVNECDTLRAIPQQGEESFYPKRNADSPELALDKTVREQFAILRTADNERFPAYFIKDGQKFYVKIYKADT